MATAQKLIKKYQESAPGQIYSRLLQKHIKLCQAVKKGQLKSPTEGLIDITNMREALTKNFWTRPATTEAIDGSYVLTLQGQSRSPVKYANNKFQEKVIEPISKVTIDIKASYTSIFCLAGEACVALLTQTSVKEFDLVIVNGDNLSTSRLKEIISHYIRKYVDPQKALKVSTRVISYGPYRILFSPYTSLTQALVESELYIYGVGYYEDKLYATRLALYELVNRRVLAGNRDHVSEDYSARLVSLAKRGFDIIFEEYDDYNHEGVLDKPSHLDKVYAHLFNSANLKDVEGYDLVQPIGLRGYLDEYHHEHNFSKLHESKHRKVIRDNLAKANFKPYPPSQIKMTKWIGSHLVSLPDEEQNEDEEPVDDLLIKNTEDEKLEDGESGEAVDQDEEEPVDDLLTKNTEDETQAKDQESEDGESGEAVDQDEEEPVDDLLTKNTEDQELEEPVDDLLTKNTEDQELEDDESGEAVDQDNQSEDQELEDGESGEAVDQDNQSEDQELEDDESDEEPL
jgi:hypothetical protein